jgi:hypothetical protein
MMSPLANLIIRNIRSKRNNCHHYDTRQPPDLQETVMAPYKQEVVQGRAARPLREVGTELHRLLWCSEAPDGRRIQDDGRAHDGVRVRVTNPSQGKDLIASGHGLPGMAERARLLGGTLTAGHVGGRIEVTAWLPALRETQR